MQLSLILLPVLDNNYNFMVQGKEAVEEVFIFLFIPTFEPHSLKTYRRTCAPNEDLNQPAQPHSLISLRCPRDETMHPWLSKMCPVKSLIRLRDCVVYSLLSRGNPSTDLGCPGSSIIIMYTCKQTNHTELKRNKGINITSPDNLWLLVLTFHLTQCNRDPEAWKRTVVHVHPTKIQISLHSLTVWSVFVVRVMKPCILGYSTCAQ